MQELKNIIESLLFVSEEPLTVDKIKGILESTDKKEIRSALGKLGEDYESRGGGFYLSEVAGGYQLRSRPSFHEYIKRLLQPSPQRLSRAALETLAVVAYRQPIIRADIEHIRGVDCGSMLRQLLERKLLRVLGRKEIPGRPLIYATTKTFLELFELNNLSELPTPAEIEQMGAVFNPGQSDDAPPPDDGPAPAAEGKPAQTDAHQTDEQTADSISIPRPEETAANDTPPKTLPVVPQADPSPMMESVDPSSDPPKTTTQQSDRDDSIESQQEPSAGDNIQKTT